MKTLFNRIRGQVNLKLLITGIVIVVFVAMVAPLIFSLVGMVDTQKCLLYLQGQGYVVYSDPGGTMHAQDILPEANCTYDLGSDAFRWSDLYLCNATIHLGSVNLTDENGCLCTDVIQLQMLQLKPDLSVPAHSESLIFYDSKENTVAYYNDEADVTHNIGQEMWIYVRNDSGSTIADGKVVYISGATGNRPTIALAKADEASTSNAIGLATHSIENNQNGYVTIQGLVHKQDTSGFSAGDVLYLSATTAGNMTITPPSAPNLVVKLAVVTVSHKNAGEILVVP